MDSRDESSRNALQSLESVEDCKSEQTNGQKSPNWKPGEARELLDVSDRLREHLKMSPKTTSGARPPRPVTQERSDPPPARDAQGTRCSGHPMLRAPDAYDTRRL